ncbi:hypothetical protein NGB36_31585 [Streptomyces sp. RB6PN25]|uniref:DUF2934 domain-containing protein n=1 Tax=Streptomyces humicola TaxID=2953240 RepID=A0ABT1Q869_9ACTN|nr:hypothetical protein [Streptomyces humicola]MCQ4084982.1 hypothetical protein [Streptomyces humicola]
MTATTQTQVIWRPAPAGPPPSAAPTPDTPIYTALVRYWRDEGRCLPGERDDEWAQLMSRPAWPADWASGKRVPAARRSLSVR